MPSNMPYNSSTSRDKFKFISLVFVFFMGKGFIPLIKDRLLSTSLAKEALELGMSIISCISANIEKYKKS